MPKLRSNSSPMILGDKHASRLKELLQLWKHTVVIRL